jgi:hypothetical protein
LLIPDEAERIVSGPEVADEGGVTTPPAGSTKATTCGAAMVGEKTRLSDPPLVAVWLSVT